MKKVRTYSSLKDCGYQTRWERARANNSCENNERTIPFYKPSKEDDQEIYG